MESTMKSRLLSRRNGSPPIGQQRPAIVTPGALYRWNSELVSALAPLTIDLEVTLRNTIHQQLTTLYGRPDWWASNDLIIDDDTNSALTATLTRHRKATFKGTLSPNLIISELSFGVWVMLLGRGGVSVLGRAVDYETKLWRSALRLGFDLGSTTTKGWPRRPTRYDVHLRAATYQRLRNRAAHHEPIFTGVHRPGVPKTSPRIPLPDIWGEGIELLSWMSPPLATIHRTTGTLPTVFANRPT